MPGPFGRTRGKRQTPSAAFFVKAGDGEILERDPKRLASAADFAALTGEPESAVLDRLCRGKLIALRHSDATQKHGIPQFQAWPEITGAPLEQILATLWQSKNACHAELAHRHAYEFFTGSHELLGGLTPLQVLTGVGRQDGDRDEQEFLCLPFLERLAFVVVLARSSIARLEQSRS